MSALHESVRANDAVAVREMLANGAVVRHLLEEQDDFGETPLFIAVSQPDVDPEIVRLLLDAGANPNFVKIEDYVVSKLEVPVIRAAIKRGNAEIVRMLHERGVDLNYKDEHGYTAIIDAVHGEGDRLPVIHYLLSLGLELNGVSTYSETAARQSYLHGDLPLARVLLKAGADERPLRWTPLHRAVALGSPEDVQAALTQRPKFNAEDIAGKTPLQLAILRGDVQIIRLLREAGAEFRRTDPLIAEAVHGGHADLVRALVEQGMDIESESSFKQTPLQIAVARGDTDMAKLLLELGAKPNPPRPGDTLLEDASTPEVIRLLLEWGADPAGLNMESRRMLAGLPKDPTPLPESLTRAEYLAERSPREGKSNPEDITGPYKLAMIRSRANAYRARTKFGDPAKIACGVRGRQPDPVWCADRFGQTATTLPDGRTIFIAGEHEDSYDPDFCIYNDVFEFSPDGNIRIFGYPYDVFPPTDFHTATPVDDVIWIIGGLGYMDARKGPIPLFRLHLYDFHIEPVSTTGEVPGRIYKHRASLLDPSRIAIEGGTQITFRKGKEKHAPNRDLYVLDLPTGRWVKGR